MDLVSRVKGILLTPRSEWAAIDAEPTTVNELYPGYIVPLAAIPAICSFIGRSIVGYSSLTTGVVVRTPIAGGMKVAGVMFLTSLVTVYVMALVIDGLAPTFGGTKSQIQALKVAAYSSTASWVVGIFALLPSLSVLRILGLYSLYLLWLGLPALMKSPEDKAVGYTVLVIVLCLVIFLVVGAIGAAIVGPGVLMGQ